MGSPLNDLIPLKIPRSEKPRRAGAPPFKARMFCDHSSPHFLMSSAVCTGVQDKLFYTDSRVREHAKRARKLSNQRTECQMFKSLLLCHAVIARRNDEAIQGKGVEELRSPQKLMTQIFPLEM